MGWFLHNEEPLGRFVGRRDYEIHEFVEFVTERLAAHFGAKEGDLALVTVPAGFVTDFASIPRFAWRILPPWDTHRLAAIVHDYLYRTQPCSREAADEVFLEAMNAIGVEPWKAQTMYWAVRFGGWNTWRKYRKAIDEKISTADAA